MSDNIDVAATISVTDQATGPIAGIERAFQGMADKARNVGQNIQRTLGSESFRKIGQNFSNLGSAFSRLGSTIGSIARPVAAVLGVASGVSLAAGIESMQNWAREAADLPRTARRLGTTVERLQELQKAAELAGVPVDAFQTAMGRANTAIRNAAIGKLPQLAGYFKNAGINIKNADGSVRSITEILPQLTANISKQTDPTLRQAIVTNIFGRGMAELLNLVGQGPQKFQEYIERAREAGLITGEQAETAIKYRRAQESVNAALESLGKQIFPALVPTLTEMANNMAAFFRDPDRRESFIKGLTGAFNALADAVKNIDWTALIKTVEGWVKWATEGDRATSLFKGGMAGLAALALAPLAKDLLGVSNAIIALSTSLLTNPIALPVLAAVGALAALGYVAYSNWDQISANFASDWQGIKNAWDDYMVPLGDAISAWLLPDDERGRWAGWWVDIKDEWARDWSDIKQGWNDYLMPIAQTAWDLLPEGLKSRLRGFWSDLKQDWIDSWNQIKAVYDQTVGRISNIWERARAPATRSVVTGATQFPAATPERRLEQQAGEARLQEAITKYGGLQKGLAAIADEERIAASADFLSQFGDTVAAVGQAVERLPMLQPPEVAAGLPAPPTTPTGLPLSPIPPTGLPFPPIPPGGMVAATTAAQRGERGLAGASGPQGPTGEVRVNVNVAAGPGLAVSATATATGNGITVEPPNVGVSMAGALA